MNFSSKHAIETLESRIAPARIIIAGIPNGLPTNDVDYTDSNPIEDAIFLDTEVEVGDSKIAAKVGPGLVGAADTFYLRMSGGDVLKVFNTQTSITDPYLQVLSGNIIAFFVDKDLDNEVDEDELTGIALGKNAKIILKSGVEGDIVANLNELGTASTADDELDMTGLISEKQTIAGIQITGGGVGGSVIAGGNISNLIVNGTVGSVLAGTAANGKNFDFFPGVDGGDGTLQFTALPKKVGASISNVFVDGLGTESSADPFNGLLQAGDGGAGGKGGSVTLIQITEDATGMTIRAGSGGTATTGSGGAGGLVSRVYVSGFPDTSVDAVQIFGGAGGSSNNAAGGAGGALKDIFIGYRLFGASPFPTDDLLIDHVAITGGAGGSGKVGGLGGSVTNVDVRVKTAAAPGVVEELTVTGGAGGSSLLAGGKAGAGGNLSKIAIRNQDLALDGQHVDLVLQGGAAGASLPTSLGALGGSVSDVTLLSWRFQIFGGNGSDGKIGGHGGSIKNVTVVSNDDILTIGAKLNAGFGGLGLAGNGGNGGSLSNINFTEADLEVLALNDGISANGGNSTGGKGGLGGSVMNVTVRDNDVKVGAIQTLDPAVVRTGTGGDGTKGGGNGGTMKLVTIEGKNMEFDIQTGAGGNALGVGKGGAGGSFDNIGVTLESVVGLDFVDATITAGKGGAGAGNNGAGGAGGDVRTVTLAVAGTGSITAGAGGGGQENNGSIKGGAAGRGGNIVVSQVNAGSGTGQLVAGNAGATGVKPGIGGSVMGLNTEVRSGVFASNDILIQAGNGSFGGAGGSVKFVGYGSATITFNPTPVGHITVRAGDGSGFGNFAGAGGSIIDVSGSLASPDLADPTFAYETKIQAGQGGASTSKSAAGGSVQDIILLGGGYAGALLTVQAGDAGDTGGATGAKGGNVRNVTVTSVDSATIFRSVAAGDGGSAVRKGGAGGSIDGVYADGLDIGNRNDVPYGFTQMGGLFAGASGDGAATSANGKVVNIVARGIGAIVAGREAAPEPAEFVDNIILSGNDTLLRERNVFVQPGPFRLSYDASVTAAETTPGADAVNEVQTVVLGVLQSSSTEVVFTFGADSTDPLPGNASADAIETALNALDSVKATGPGGAGGSVSVVATTDGFTITFEQDGNKTGVFTAAVTAETALLPLNATSQAVETALNALPTIQYLGAGNAGGAVDVTGSNGSFRVTFMQSGNVIPLDGVEVFNSNLTEVTAGDLTSTFAQESTPGAAPLLVTEQLSGQQSLFTGVVTEGTDSDPEFQEFSVDNVFSVPGAQVQFAFGASFVATEVGGGGDAVTREVQTINLAGVRSDARSTFTLTFNGLTSAALPYNASQTQIQAALNAMATVVQAQGVAASLAANGTLTLTFNQNGPRSEFSVGVQSTTALLPATSTDVEFETAVNGMGAVKVTAADRVSGAVDIRATAANAFFLDFLQDGDQQLVTLNGFVAEVQDIETDVIDATPLGTFGLSFSRDYLADEAVKGSASLRERQDIAMGSVLGSANSSFTLTYGNRVSAVIPATATPTQIAQAINQMGVGNVTVVFGSGVNAGKLQITFALVGDQPNLFSAQVTSRTASLPTTATATEVQDALNALPTIKGPTNTESVTVIRDVDNNFEVAFSAIGQRNMISAAMISQEEQQVDVTSILTEPTGSFRIEFGGVKTPELPIGTTAADLQTALNALSTIDGVGEVTVLDGGAPGLYTVRFNVAGDQAQLTVITEIDEVQDVDFAAGKPLTLTVSKDFTAVEAIAGAPGVPEVQVLTLGPVLGSAAEFTLTFAGQTTVSLAGTATAAQIQQALENLATIGTGNVTVEVDVDTIQVTFAAGQQLELLTARATQSTPELAADATAGDYETALNALATVQAGGDNAQGGTVAVTSGGGSNFSVRFNSGGDQELIVATQEQTLQIFTIREGTISVQELQAFSPQAKGQPLSSIYAVANIIGFYSDHTELDANVFHFYHEGERTSSLARDFLPGDEPIDGLVFAKKMNQARLTVTPEAYRVGDVFYDWNNQI